MFSENEKMLDGGGKSACPFLLQKCSGIAGACGVWGVPFCFLFFFKNDLNLGLVRGT